MLAAVAGGDGTINEAVNGLAVHSSLPLAFLPLGTADVLAANEGSACRAAPRGAGRASCRPRRRRASDPPRPRFVTAERNEPWRFLLMAGIGFDAEVVANLDSKLKRRIGKGAYVIGSLAPAWRGTSGGLFDTRLDGEPKRSAPGSLVGRARRISMAGASCSRPKRGSTGLSSTPCCSRHRRAIAALRYMAGGGDRNAWQRQCDVERAARRSGSSSTGPEGAPVQIDGDVRVDLPIRVGMAEHPSRAERVSWR